MKYEIETARNGYILRMKTETRVFGCYDDLENYIRELYSLETRPTGDDLVEEYCRAALYHAPTAGKVVIPIKGGYELTVTKRE